MITLEELSKLQKLSKISFSSEELETVTKQLSSIMDLIDDLKSVDCDNVEPLRSVSKGPQPLREDKVVTENIEEKLFANVPAKNIDFAKEVKCFIVPKMVE